MNLDLALQTFLEESRELLTDMERILLELETAPDDAELYNALFRSVHTIKGSAGMFGLDHVVEFTHVVENQLDRLRMREIVLSKELTNALLQCRDHIALLVEIPELIDKSMQSVGDLLLQELCAAGARGVESEDRHESGERHDVWHISLRFDRDVLRHGMDPIGFIHYLAKLGSLKSVTTVVDALPELSEMDAESCYLGFEIDLITQVGQEEIEQVFEFVEGLCELRILPPRSNLQAYLTLLQQLPEEPQRLGEMLVASGALTEAQLNQCLAIQAAENVPPPKPIGEVLVESGTVAPELVEAALEKQQQSREKKSNQYLRVQAEKLDQLINLVGEMVIASASVSLNASLGGDTTTRESAAAMSLLVEEIRDRSLQLRMVPIGDTFQRQQRIVRDVANELDKEIELIITGADTELDKTVVEKISDPLTHLVRNACDHGLETSAKRRAAGKACKGQLRLDAYHESGAIIIEVSDDGAGLDRVRILQKAIERGLVQNDSDLTDQEIFNLIFEPGFSTAELVTSISGRGVGMDVVRRNIEALRGTVEVHSQEGCGTRFRIRLPLTLAIIDGFLSSVGDSTYVVPLEMVEECVELRRFSQNTDTQSDLLDLRGEVLPLLRLREHFGVTSSIPRRQNVLVVNYGGNRIGLVVDELLGEHQTVIKPLNELFSRVRGLSGSTILGSGKVALILDVPGLMQLAVRRTPAQMKERPATAAAQQISIH